MDTDVLVIGAGAAGLAAAAELRRTAPALGVTVVDAAAANVYRPWLIHLPTRTLAPGDPCVPISAIADRLGFTFRQEAVQKIDPDGGTVVTDQASISFRSVLVACGAPADRQRIPGAAEHALFPCDVDDAETFAERCRQAGDSTPITVVVSGERIGPGLEYAAYLAKKGISRKVQLVADGPTLAQQFGERPAQRVESLLRKQGVEVVTGREVAGVEQSRIAFRDGSTVESGLTAVVGPLRGVGSDLGLPADALTPDGFLRVDGSLRVEAHRNLLGAGDVICAPVTGWRPSWLLAKKTAVVAARTIAADLNGGQAGTFSLDQGRKLSRVALPDLGGTVVFISNGKVRASGAWLGRLRRRADRAHFAAYAPGENRLRRLA